MLNGPSFRTPVQREISDAVNTAGIGTGTAMRMQNSDGLIAHEVSAVLAIVARDKQIPLYLGHEPGGNYLSRVHHLPEHYPIGVNQLRTGPETIRYTPKGGVGMTPADLRMLASSYQDRTAPSNPNMFDYKPGGCSGGYCGN